MRVLIAYDSSAGAEQALALGGAIRWPAGSTLHIVTVIEPPMLYLGPQMGGGTVLQPEIEGDITALAEKQISDGARRLQAGGRTVEGAVLRGRPATVLVEEAMRLGADLVICGSRGHGGISSLLLGSVSAEVVDHAPCPVLVARNASIGRVVFATDGSAPAAAAETLLSWPIFEGMPIDVVSVADVVQPWHTGIAPTMYAQVLEAHARDLAHAKAECTLIAEETVARLRVAGRTARAVVRTGDAAAEIIAASESGADLVVIGSRGRTGLARIFLGSVARNVLHGGDISVLVVHSPMP